MTVFPHLRKIYSKAYHSIGFLPAVMSVAFLGLAVLLLGWDQSGIGIQLNRLNWLNLNDAGTANSILSTVTAGLISMTVFSFSMVMIVMGQAASHMSNRMIDNVIDDRKQKTILGFYTGTIVYTLFVFANVSDASDNVPILSIYFLLLLTIIDIFLFIYFLHHITQSFKYDQQIQKIQMKANASLAKLASEAGTSAAREQREGGQILKIDKSGYYQGFFRKKLQKIAVDHNIVIEFLHPIGTHLLRGMPVAKVYGQSIPENQILDQLDLYYGQEIDKNAYYGFFHLTEVAVKALSPGINDSGTAVLVVNALSDLFQKVIHSPIADALTDDTGHVRIIIRQIPVEKIFEKAVLPIWDYGKDDRLVNAATLAMLRQLIYVFDNDLRVDFIKHWLDTFESHNSIAPDAGD